MKLPWNLWVFATAWAASMRPAQAASPDSKSEDLRIQKRCSHPIYCDGPILKRIQLSGVFSADKTFVDMPTRRPVDEIIQAFNRLPQNATKDELTKFVNANFWPAGSDVVKAELEDWIEAPPFLDGITDPVLRGYGMALHNKWKELARKRDTSFLCDGCETSLLPVNHTFVISGSNSSREFRYWDTYYIELGLLKSGLYKTAKGVLQNLLDAVGIHGFVPTGGRVYYTDRSEPPLLALMVKTYYDATKDLDFVARALPLLKKEHTFWETYRSVNVTYTRNTTISLGKRQAFAPETASSGMNTFGPGIFEQSFDGGSSSDSEGVYYRPELYRSDFELSNTQSSTFEFFSEALSGADLYAASEAGTVPSVQYADPSAYRTEPQFFEVALRRRGLEVSTFNPFAKFTLKELEVIGSSSINDTVAVNLNSILYQAELIIADFSALLNNGTDTSDSVAYRKRAEERWQTLFDLTYNPKTGLFSDYHISSGLRTNIWSINSLWPYWAFGDKVPADGAKLALATISDLHENATSAEKKLGLDGSVSSKFRGIGAKLVQSTINNAFCGWYTSGGSISGVLHPFGAASEGSVGATYESYQIGADGNVIPNADASTAGDFSWTNGITLWLFDSYKSQLQPPKCPNIELKLVDAYATTSAPPAPPAPPPSPPAPPSNAPTSAPVPTTAPPRTTAPPPTTAPSPTATHTPTPTRATSMPPTSSSPPRTTCAIKRRCTKCKCLLKRRSVFKRKILVRK
ncbi:hypothetical protein GGI12_002486 [Dipsacomyces acuminosporus]|nr:hypothetical protein GGI12_002486 [Dipsacomyces acuminosporus]